MFVLLSVYENSIRLYTVTLCGAYDFCDLLAKVDIPTNQCELNNTICLYVYFCLDYKTGVQYCLSCTYF